MMEANENLDRLVEAITLYCDQCKRFQRVPYKESRRDTSSQLKEIFKELLPEITANIDYDLPPPIYVHKVISRGVDGINNKLVTVIWKEYFFVEVTKADVAEKAGCKLRSVTGGITSFPKNVAYQLWEKNHELANPQTTIISTRTIEQQQHEAIPEAFKLTKREREIMLALARPGTRLSQKEVALQYGIKKNTIKTHLRSVRKKMNAKNTSEATNMIREIVWADNLDNEL